MSGLPAGWTKAPVTDFTALHDNRRIPLNAKQRATMRGRYPYYGANGLVDHINDYLFDGEYTLLAEDGGYFDDPKRGVAYEASGKFWVNNHAHILEPLGGISNRFLRHALNAFGWMPYVGGSTRLKLTQGGLQRAQLGLPPLPEQDRIVAKIDSLSAKSRRARDHLDHIPRLVEKYKQSILATAFDLSNNADWKWGTVEEVVDDALVGLVRSKSQQSGTRGTPYIRMNHFDLEGNWNDEELTRVNLSDNEARRYELRAGDVLFNTRNSYELVGKVGLWSKKQEPHVYNNNLLRLRFKDGVVPKFAFYWMRSPSFRTHLQSVKSATTSVCAIYQRSLMAAPLGYPVKVTQERIVRRIETAFAWIDRLATEATCARKLINHLDQSTLTKAFRGELVPQDSNDEPASVLLERIRAERAAAPPSGSRRRVGNRPTRAARSRAR